MGKPKAKNATKEKEIFIDLTQSSSSSDEVGNVFDKSFDESLDNTLFSPPIKIAGNVLTSRHYWLLKQGGWFTDDLINGYFHLLSSKQVFSFSSFLLTAARNHGIEYVSKFWMRPLRQFLGDAVGEDQLILFPVNSGGSHWVLVAWWCRKGLMQYFDSLMCKRTGTRIMEKLKGILEACRITSSQSYSSSEDELDCLEQFMSSLSLTAPKEESSKVPPITKLEIPAKQPRQQDGSSCGPFTCAFAEALVHGKPLCSLDQSTVDDFRLILIDLFLQHK